MMEQHVRRARRRRRGVSADDAVERERRLDGLVLEPLAEEIRGALREEIGDEPLILERQPEHARAEPRALEGFEHAAARVGRRPEHEIAQHGRRPFERRIVGGQTLGISRRELGNRPLPRREPVGHEQCAPRVDRPEVGGRSLHDPETVPRKIEIGNDLGIEQAHRVGGHRVAEPGVELLRHRRAAHDVVLFEDDDGKTRRREIRRRDEAIVPAADDRDVVRRRHLLGLRHRPSLQPRSRTMSGRIGPIRDSRKHGVMWDVWAVRRPRRSAPGGRSCRCRRSGSAPARTCTPGSCRTRDSRGSCRPL